MARTRKQPEQRREEILLHSFALFQEFGFRNVTMDHIAKRCGIARTTLYEYFASKEEILLTLAGQVAQEVHSFEIQPTNCLEGLKQLASAFLERIQSHRELYLILFREAPVLSPDISQKLLTWRSEQFHQVLHIAEMGAASGQLRFDVKPQDVAFVFQAIIGQRAGELLMLNQQVCSITESERLVNLMWKGIGVTTQNTKIS